MDFFSGCVTNRGLTAAYTAAQSAQRKASELELDGMTLEHRVDRLALACQALWEILSERAGITQDEMAAKMTEIDLRDGRQDGKIGNRVVQCPSCGRNVNSARSACMFCGAPVASDTVVT